MIPQKLFKFEIQKYGQILYAHKTHFLMPGHIYIDYMHAYTYMHTLIEQSINQCALHK